MSGEELITSSRLTSLRQLIASTTRVDWTRFEGAAGLRCTIGIAVPLLVGFAADDPYAALFGAFGAFGVGFGSFQGAYRSRAIPMLLATLGMALSVYVGSVASRSIVTATLVAGCWGFAGGLLVALGQSASFVGLQSILALLIAGGVSRGVLADAGSAAFPSLFVLGGGLGQTLLVIMIWPLRRFSAERRSLAAAYRSIAAYASSIPRYAEPPEPHTMSGTVSPLVDPQPFATSGEMLGFQALLDEAQGIRASLAALALHYQRLSRRDRSCVGAVSSLATEVLQEIAAALASGRAPRALPGVRASLTDCGNALPPGIRIDPLIAQLDAAWRTASLLAAAPRGLGLAGESIERLPKERMLRDALTTLRANLSFDSTAFRHALRLGATISLAQGIATGFELPRGHWVPLTAAVMLKPDFRDAFATSIARVGGTALGAVGAIALAQLVGPESAPSLAILLVLAWAAYALAAVNAIVFAVCLTGYVVFLLAVFGAPQGGVAAERIVNTAVGGALALFAYVWWPTWTPRGIRDVLATMLDRQAAYLRALLAAYTDPVTADRKGIDELRTSARQARSNAEAIVEKLFSGPYRHHPIKWRTAMGTLAANRRIALAALALRAGLQAEGSGAVPTIEPLARDVSQSLRSLATSLRGESPVPERLSIDRADLAGLTAVSPMIGDEVTMIVDGIRTIALLFRSDRDGPV